MKTKYVKITVSERLPEKSGVYLANWKTTDGSEAWKTSMFINTDDDCRAEWRCYVECFYEKVPDHSEEMLSLLEKVVGFTSLGERVPDYITHEIEELFNKMRGNES